MKTCYLANWLTQLAILVFAVTSIFSLPTTNDLIVHPKISTDQHNGSKEVKAWQDILKTRAVSGKSAIAQVSGVLSILASECKSFLPSEYSIREVNSELRKGLRHRGRGRDRIEVFFIIYGGTNGDVPLVSSVLQRMLDRSDIYNVKHCIVFDESFRNFFPESLQRKFAADNRGWASRTNPPLYTQAASLFLEKMRDILTRDNWKPDLIVTGHFIANATPDQRAEMKRLTAPSRTRLLVELAVFYLPGIKSLTLNDVKPNYLRIYGQQPELWEKSDVREIGAAMVGKFPRQLSNGFTSSATSKEPRTGEVYTWLDQQNLYKNGRKFDRRIFYMGLGMREREFDKTNAFPAFMQVAESELKAASEWSFIIFHNARKSESHYNRITNGGRVFHLFVGETSWSTLFPEMSVVLTHGGIGSMTDAIAAGVPQIILPTDFAPDQKYFSNQLDSKEIPIGIGLETISIFSVQQGKLVTVQDMSAIGAGRLVTAQDISDAFAKVRAKLSEYRNNIKPYQKLLADTNALDNTFNIIDRMCDAMVDST